MDAYELNEKIGRNKFENDIKAGTLYEFTKDKYCPVDCHLTGKSKTYVVEIKNRNIPLEQYKNDGYILELSKYNALMNEWKYSGYTPEYVNYFQDGRIVWKITDIDIAGRVEKKWCTATTATDYGKRVIKDVIMLKYDEAYDKQRYS